MLERLSNNLAISKSIFTDFNPSLFCVDKIEINQLCYSISGTHLYLRIVYNNSLFILELLDCYLTEETLDFQYNEFRNVSLDITEHNNEIVLSILCDRISKLDFTCTSIEVFDCNWTSQRKVDTVV